jgi:hypothetical protein
MIALLTDGFRRCEARYHRPLAKAEICFFGDYFSFKCYGMPSAACGPTPDREVTGSSRSWKWSAEERVSEGDPENWAAVARAISGRVREFGWRQRELAERSHVSVAVVREIQRHTVERRRSPRTLEVLSVALGWEPEYLHRVLKGHPQQSGGHTSMAFS